MTPMAQMNGLDRPDCTEDFLCRARSDAERLRGIVELVDVRPASATLASIETLAHRLHGAANTHGFRAIEIAAIRLERLAEQLHTADIDPLPGQFRAVTSAAHQLCATIARSAD
jgi:HPt (histidine-containing phosphotransfer) domain-containing protein